MFAVFNTMLFSYGQASEFYGQASEFCGVFSTEEKAKEYIAKKGKESVFFEIEEITPDEEY